jgi:hypothetical protein
MLVTLILVTTLLLTACVHGRDGNASQAADRDGPVWEISSGDDGAQRAAVYVIKSKDELETGPIPNRLRERIVASIDFRSQAAVVLFAGTRTSGGYRLRLEDYDYSDQRVIIRIAEEAPGPDSIVTQALTYPHIVIGVDDPPASIFVEGPRRNQR